MHVSPVLPPSPPSRVLACVGVWSDSETGGVCVWREQKAWDDNWEAIYALSEVIMQNTIKSYMAK
jgi:hypothetical protein